MNINTSILSGLKIWFRTDASFKKGSGHVMRCLTLAKQCRHQGAKITFVSRSAMGNLHDMIKRAGFDLISLPQQISAKEDPYEILALFNQVPLPDWMIIDHYDIDIAWEQVLKSRIKKIMVIDDLANRKHDCDILMDSNLQPDQQTRYNALIPPDCKLLLGPSYALLRQEFIEERYAMRSRDGKVHRLLVSFGGSDPTGETLKVFDALADWTERDFHIDFILGSANIADYEDMYQRAKQFSDITIYKSVNFMASLMSQADIAIGAGGSTTWERLYLGLPSAVIVVAENQLSMTKEAEKNGLCWFLGRSGEVGEQEIRQWTLMAKNHPEALMDVTARAFRLMEFTPGQLHPVLPYLKGGAL